MVATYPARVSILDAAALSDPASRDDAVAALHELLLRAARFELSRRHDVPPGERDDLALQAADDALVAVLRKLHTFRGESRFTTWAYKFAVLEAAVAARRRAWRDRDVRLDDDPSHPALRDPAPTAQERAEEAELLAAIREAMQTALTPRQREVLIALALDGVPIDVLAERLGTTRGALYKVLHDARAKLRAEIGWRTT
jgi:RNA polymerase sigma-70 factor (ECF subfamily)